MNELSDVQLILACLRARTKRMEARTDLANALFELRRAGVTSVRFDDPRVAPLFDAVSDADRAVSVFANEIRRRRLARKERVR